MQKKSSATQIEINECYNELLMDGIRLSTKKKILLDFLDECLGDYLERRRFSVCRKFIMDDRFKSLNYELMGDVLMAIIDHVPMDYEFLYVSQIMRGISKVYDIHQVAVFAPELN